MTKEKIIDNIIYRQTDGEEYACLKKEDCMNAMQDYADQETERLKAELEAKDKEIEMLKNTIAIMQEQDSQLSDVALSVEEIELELGFKLSEFVQKYKWLLHAIESWKKEEEINIEHVKQLQSELSELKERHKLLNNILGSNTPFPLNEILKGLIESAHILLHKKDYDGHGWEHLEHCYKKAKDVNDLIEQYYKQKFEK